MKKTLKIFVGALICLSALSSVSCKKDVTDELDSFPFVEGVYEYKSIVETDYDNFSTFSNSIANLTIEGTNDNSKVSTEFTSNELIYYFTDETEYNSYKNIFTGTYDDTELTITSSILSTLQAQNVTTTYKEFISNLKNIKSNANKDYSVTTNSEKTKLTIKLVTNIENIKTEATYIYTLKK